MPAKPNLAAQATAEFVSLTFDAEIYTLPTQDMAPIAFLEAYEENNLIAALRALIGPEQYARFRATHETVGDMSRFFNAAGEKMGGNL